MEDAEMDHGPDITVAKEVAGLLSARIELVVNDVFGDVWEGSTIDPDDAVGSMQDAGEQPSKPPAHAGDEDCAAIRGGTARWAG